MRATGLGSRASDESLMVRVQSDDFVAFAELYGRHVGPALEVAIEICRDDGMAEDAVQEGFLGIWRSRADYRPELGTFRVWSMRIVHNRAVDSIRAVRGRPRLDVFGAPGPSPTEVGPDDASAAAIGAAERAQLLVAMRRLPEVQTEVILLSFYGGLSHFEIAARLGIPAGTVKGRIRSGLEKLRYELSFADRRVAG